MMKRIQVITIMGICSLFGCNPKNTNKMNFENLTPELQVQLRNELKRDTAKEFNPEFVRTTNLEYSIIETYGFEGVKLVLERQNSKGFYLLGDFPAACPWSGLNATTNTEFIDQNFKSISKDIPTLLASLKNRCKFIYAEKRENTWQVHYLLEMKLYDDRSYFKIYTGGAPLLNAAPNKNLKAYDWQVPDDLKKFYSVHNGFGEINDANFVMGNDDIKVMAAMMDPICKEQNTCPEGYSFSDLLEFFPDGARNAECFHKNGSNMTVDWDHEVWEISGEVGFFEFINERMAEIDEE